MMMRLLRKVSTLDKLLITADKLDAGQRIDRFLADSLPEMTRSALQKLFEDGLIIIGEKPVPKNYKLRGGEVIEAAFPEAQPLDVAPQDIPLDIRYEDEDLLVVNKPKGMVVHPAPGHFEGTLVNALLHHCGGQLSGINGVIRPGIVHRIDKDTSGLLVVAKNDLAHRGLAAQLQEHSMQRVYNAVVYGRFSEEEGTVDAPIGRDPRERKRMCVTEKNSRLAVTHYRVLNMFSQFSNLELQLETGRTHQIRVHMAYKGHPVAGDPVYGPKKVITSLDGQCLHARTLGFTHPRSGELVFCEAELPDYYTRFLASLR